MSMLAKRLGVLVTLTAVAAGVAFVYAHDPVLAGYRQSLTLENEPTGSVTIEDARKQIDKKTDVVLTLRIGVREISQWWQEETASFFASEATEGSHYNASGDHDPNSCPFCRHKWNVDDSMALIHLVDDSGNRIPVTAPKLLNVEDGDVVVVRGKASLDKGLLVVESSGIFVRE